MLVGAVVGLLALQLGAGGRAEARVVQAQAVEPVHELTVGLPGPLLVRAAGTAQELHLGTGSGVVEALALGLQLPVEGVRPGLRRGAVAGKDLDPVAVDGGIPPVVDALALVPRDRTGRQPL